MAGAWEARFDELSELDADQRALRLAEIARSEPALAQFLHELLAADAEETGLLAAPLAERDPSFVAAALAARTAPRGRDRTGERIGQYRLLSLLGRGGMAEVWLAERADGEFDSRVAVKLVRPELGSEAILSRFLRERRILARLENPGIARLLDGGRSASGEPYFVLEHVAGTPITAWCAARGSSLDDRLRLIIDVCAAVDHAHRSLVVHRDLKPSNVLVDDSGRPKLLDFGIAKLLAPQGGRDLFASGDTRLEALALTPAYAAPEQILGGLVTTATDVYALGVLLYELLTGEKPHPRRARPLPVLAGEVAAETLELPSERVRRAVAAGSAPSEARRRAARLAGDLDTIVAKALHPQPERRYSTAAALAEDLRRHLDGRPVAARPDSLTYRAGRFIRRHRLGAGAAALIAVSLLGGLAAALWQARVARAEARRAERVRGFLVDLFREADPSHTLGARITAREILETGAARIERELGNEPDAESDLLDAVAQVEHSLGLLEAARHHAESSIAVRRAFYGPAAAETAASRVTLAEILFDSGGYAAAQREIAAAGPALAAADEASHRLGEVNVSILAIQGKVGEALAESRRQLAAAEAVRPDGFRTARWRLSIAGLLSSSRVSEAIPLAREALAAMQRASDASQIDIAQAQVEAAELFSFAGDKKASGKLMSEAVALQRQILGPKHPYVAASEIKYGLLLHQLHREAEAEQVLLDAASTLHGLGHFEEGSALRYLGFCLLARGQAAEAERRFSDAEEVFRVRLGAAHAYVWSARLDRGGALIRLGRLAEAEKLLRAVAGEFERTEGPEGDSLRTALKHLGEVRRLRGDAKEALALHRRARDIELAIFGTAEHPSVAASDLQIALDGLALSTPGLLAEARQRAAEGITILRKADPESPRLTELLAAQERIDRIDRVAPPPLYSP